MDRSIGVQGNLNISDDAILCLYMLYFNLFHCLLLSDKIKDYSLKTK